MMPFFHIGPLTLPGYGSMIMLGIICGMVLLWWHSKRKKFPFQDAFYAFIYGALGLAVGAKLLFLIQAMPEIIAHWDMLMRKPEQLWALVGSGFVFYGGLFGGVAGVLIYAKQYRLSFRGLFEHLVPVIPFVHAFGRIGCFLAGCCYGIPYDGPLHVIFVLSDIAPKHTPLFPVQLLESALLFLLAAFLLLYDAKAKKPRSLIGWYLLLYGVIRMFTEMFRGDLSRGGFLFFSTSQWISVAVIIVAIVILIKFKSPPSLSRLSASSGSSDPESPPNSSNPESPSNSSDPEGSSDSLNPSDFSDSKSPFDSDPNSPADPNLETPS